jgi:hypothetical protein
MKSEIESKNDAITFLLDESKKEEWRNCPPFHEIYRMRE